MGLPPRMISWDINGRQHLHYGQQHGSFLLVCGAGAAPQDVSEITFFKSPGPAYPSLSMLLSSHGGRSSVRIGCSSSPMWRSASPNANASEKAEPIEELWEEYFADPSRWWDNRVDKRNSKSPDFKHKVTKKALWIEGWSTPAWVVERLMLGTRGEFHSHVGYCASNSQDTAQSNRLRKNNGRRNNVPSIAQEFRHSEEGGRMNMRTASTTSEAVAIVKTRLQQGLTVDSYMYVEVLKRCSKQKDLRATKEVHECIIKSGMEQHTYVANNLLTVYIRCGRLQDARQVFDKLLDKDVFCWTIMIGGYAQHSCAEYAMEAFNQMRREGVQPSEVTYLSILKAFVTPAALKWGKEVHMYIRHDGLESDLRVGNSLVHMYAKSGSIDDAQLVFEKMEERNVITWSAMIGGLADHGRGHEAYELFLQMQREGCAPNAITYLSILNACASIGALEWVKDVHTHVVEAGLESDLRVGNALVHSYMKSGCIDDARRVFDRMAEHNAITWNTLIGGLVDYGCGDEAYELFLRMQSEGCVPDAITYMSILNALSSSGLSERVGDIHRHVVEAGLESDFRVSNALVQSYLKVGQIDDAQLVFDRIEDHNVITWNILIGRLAHYGHGNEAYELFLRMQTEGCVPDAITYMSILNACASTGALDWVKDVHTHVLKAGLGSDLCVGNALVHSYLKSGSVDDARLVFDRMGERDVITWSAMIGGLAGHGCGHEAYELFLRMQREGCVPNTITYTSILNVCSSTGALEWVKDIHRHVVEAGLESDVRVGTALVHSYLKSGSVDDARLVFDRMGERDVIAWSAMIGGLAGHGCGHEAYELFLRMQREGCVPNASTYVSILNVSASTGALEWAKDIHRHVVEAELESDVRVGTALVHSYLKSGCFDDARLVFDRMGKRDVVAWGAMIGGLAQHGRGHEALEYFSKMEEDGVKPDDCSFVSVLSGCSHAGLVDDGHRLFSSMVQDYGIKPNVLHCNCMVDLLGRVGYLEEAKSFIDNMPVEANAATWGALLGACRTYGNVELGELAASQISKLDPKDSSPYVLLSNIYAAAGKWEEVSLVRSMMEERGIRKEPGRSWIEVDGIIHDFVVGDTSHPEAKEIYAELNRLTESIKAEGYVPDTRLVLKDIEEGDKELALCSHSEKLAIAFGLIHIPHGKPIRVFKNLRVCSDCHSATKFISKVTKREIVARDASRFHHFKDGVCSCGDYW